MAHICTNISARSDLHSPHESAQHKDASRTDAICAQTLGRTTDAHCTEPNGRFLADVPSTDAVHSCDTYIKTADHRSAHTLGSRPKIAFAAKDSSGDRSSAF